MEKAKYYISMLTLLAAFVMICVVFTWLLYPYKTIEFMNSPFPVDKIIYRANDCLRIQMEYERFIDKPSIAIFQFTDGITFTMLPMQFQKSPGKFKGTSVSIRIPSILPPGKYYLDMCFTYKMNPIRDIVVTARTQEFEVQ